MVSAGSGNIEAQQTEQAQQSAAYQAYIKYKATQQKPNVSDNYNYTTNRNPEYYGESVPQQQTAREVLAKRDEQAKEIPTYTYEQRASSDETKNTVSPIIIKNQYSEGTKNFNIQTEKDIAFLKTAKEAGITEITLYNEKGEKIGSTNPQDITKARYDILKAELKEGKPITFSYTTNKTNYTINLHEGDNRTTRQKLADAQGSIVTQQGNEAVSFLKVPFIGQKVTTNEIPSTSFVNVLQFVPFGMFGAIDKIPVSEIVKTESNPLIKATTTLLEAKTTISRIEKAMQEDNLIIGTEKTVNPKIVQISQGTVGKSGIESFKPERAPIQVERLPSGKVQATNPPLPPNIKEKETILSIGRKGEAVPIEKGAEIKLEPGLEGMAKVPISLRSEEGNIIMVRSETQKSLPPNAILMVFQGITKESAARQAEFYGLKPIQEAKNAYYGKITPELVIKLNFDIKGNAVITGTDIFEFKEQDVLTNEKLYYKVTQNPEILKSDYLPEDIVRPFVIRTYEAKGYTEKALIERQNEFNKEPSKENNPLFPKQSIEEIKERYPLMTSHETPGKETLLDIEKKNPEAVKNISDIFNKGQTKQENIKSNIEENRKRNVMTETDFIFETIITPSNTFFKSTKESSTKSELLNKMVNEIVNKPKQESKRETSTDEITGLLTGHNVKQTQEQKTTPITEQTTRQTTKQIHALISSGSTPPPTRQTPTPIEIPNIPLFENTLKKEAKKKEKKPIGFLGNVPQYEILGMYKREEIIHNEKLINKISRKEKTQAGKHGKFESVKAKHFKLSNNKVSFKESKNKKLKEIKF